MEILEKAKSDSSIKLEKFEDAYNQSKLNDAVTILGTNVGYRHYGTTVDESKNSLNVHITFRKITEDDSLSSYMNFFDSLYELAKYMMKDYKLNDIQVKYKTTDNILAMYFIIIYKK